MRINWLQRGRLVATRSVSAIRLTVLMVAVGGLVGWLMFQEQDYFGVLVAALLFVPSLGLLYAQLFVWWGKPWLTLRHSGLAHYWYGDIAWKDVCMLQLSKAPKSRSEGFVLLSLTTNNGVNYRNRLPLPIRLITRKSSSPSSMSEVPINLRFLNVPANEIAQAVMDFYRQAVRDVEVKEGRTSTILGSMGIPTPESTRPGK